MKRASLWLLLMAILTAVWIGSSLSPRPGAPRSKPTPPDRVESAGLDYPEGLSEESLRDLEQWLGDSSSTRQGGSGVRDIFQEQQWAPARPLPLSEEVDVAEARVELPRLTGFLYEPTEPVAAIEFEGRMWLVKLGGSLGRYRVERMVPGEEVYLIDTQSGEALLLTLND